MDQIRIYRFSQALLLKSPWTFRELTRSLLQFKSNSRLAQFLMFKPLTFLKIEPAVHQAAAPDFLCSTPCVYMLITF